MDKVTSVIPMYIYNVVEENIYFKQMKIIAVYTQLKQLRNKA